MNCIVILELPVAISGFRPPYELCSSRQGAGNKNMTIGATAKTRRIHVEVLTITKSPHWPVSPLNPGLKEAWVSPSLAKTSQFEYPVPLMRGERLGTSLHFIPQGQYHPPPPPPTTAETV